MLTQAATAVTNTVPTVGPAIGVGLTYTMFGPGGFRGRGPRRRWWSPESGTPSPSSACRCWPWPWCCCRAAPAASGSPWPWPASPPWWPPSWSSRCCAARSWPAGSGCWPVGRFAATADPPAAAGAGWELATVRFRTRTLELLEHGWGRSPPPPWSASCRCTWCCWVACGRCSQRRRGLLGPGAVGVRRRPAALDRAGHPWRRGRGGVRADRAAGGRRRRPGAGDRRGAGVPGPDLGAADPGRGRLLPVVAPKPAASPARHPGWCPAGGHPQGCGGGRQRPTGHPGTR